MSVKIYATFFLLIIPSHFSSQTCYSHTIVNSNAHMGETPEELIHRCLDHVKKVGIRFAPSLDMNRFIWEVAVHINRLISNGNIYYHKNVAQKEIWEILGQHEFKKHLQHLHQFEIVGSRTRQSLFRPPLKRLPSAVQLMSPVRI